MSTFIYSQITWEQLKGPVEIEIKASYILKSGKIFQFTNPYGMYSSTDKGASWQENMKGLEPNSCDALYYFFKVSPFGLIYFHDGCRLYTFDDLNNQWTKINDKCSLMNFCFSSDGSIIIAGNEKNLFTSTDSGRTFIKKAEWWTHSLQLYSFGKDSNIVELSTGASYGRYKFNNNIDTFIEITNGGGGGPLLFEKNSKTLFSFEYWVFKKSIDFGISWDTFFIDNLSRFYCGYASFIQNNNIYLFGGKNYKSNDLGMSWNVDSTYPNLGKFLISEYASYSDKNEIVLNSSNSSALLLPRNLITELVIPIAKPNITKILPIAENNIICYTNDKIYHSLDEGKNWNRIGERYEYILGFSNGDLLKYRTSNFIQYSTDYGLTWNNIKLPKSLRTQFVKITSKDEILIWNYDTNYISSNKGENWTAIPNSVKSYSFKRPSLSSNDIFYVKTDDTIFYSLDYGLTTRFFKADDDYDDYCFLSKNNIFYWLKENFIIDGAELYYSVDLGKTKEKFNFKWPEKLLLIDNEDRIFTSNNNFEIKLEIRSSINNYYDYSTFQGIEPSSRVLVNNIAVDKEGYLYCSVPGQPLYKSIQKTTHANKTIDNSKKIKFKINYLPECITINIPHEYHLNYESITLNDALGNVFHKFEIQENQIIIKREDYLTGIYYLQLKSKNGSNFIQKILIR
ncbi:MAG: hypothetical protein HOP11_15630 [Saprospiraceae bacterium]|nr:hypothetical protein [Saprospiraceae bacterium]